MHAILQKLAIIRLAAGPVSNMLYTRLSLLRGCVHAPGTTHSLAQLLRSERTSCDSTGLYGLHHSPLVNTTAFELVLLEVATVRSTAGEGEDSCSIHCIVAEFTLKLVAIYNTIICVMSESTGVAQKHRHPFRQRISCCSKFTCFKDTLPVPYSGGLNDTFSRRGRVVWWQYHLPFTCTPRRYHALALAT